MLHLLLWSQLAAAQPARADSVYSSNALRDLIAAASIENRAPPPSFRSYRARIESEIGFILRDTLGREQTGQIEQLAATADWTRSNEYNVRFIGYRSQSVGVPYSALSIVRGWTVPSLYGERLLLGAYFPQSTRRTRDSIVAVHPFSRDRERFYRYTGGDTVAVLRVGERSIPIVRIHVLPHLTDETRFAAFEGEIDLDADRHQIVRMRGQFVVVSKRSGAGRPILARGLGVTAVAFVEFVNAEVNGKYWLPAFQRNEFQAAMALIGTGRAVFRLVSRFTDYAVEETAGVVSDSLARPRFMFTYAPSDSMDRFGDWKQSLGAATAAVHADDFNDIGPDSWRAEGPPRFDVFPTSLDRMLRFNRVEGAFTGITPSIDFRSAFPGLSAGAQLGWAWAENTARGGARVTYKHTPWILGVRAERVLASTNDFVLPFENDYTLSAFFASIDDADYVDRRVAMFSATRIFESVDRAIATVQLGAASDHPERARISHGLIRGDGFRPNRGSLPGSYALAMADLEIHPNVDGDNAQPGVGAKLHFEAATGDLDWQRIELRLAARKYFGPVMLAAHADGGIVIASNPPPQSLFEFGGVDVLPSYQYKEFVGDRAALFRTFLAYHFPVLKRPFRVWRSVTLPGVNPGFAVGVQGGWTELSSDAARRAVDQLGAGGSSAPVSRATGGAIGTVGFGVTAFGDLMHLGLARPIDHQAPWRLVLGFGGGF